MKPRRNNKPVIDDGHMDPVEVFARIKTVTEENHDNLCIEYVDDKTIQCTPPASIQSDKGMIASFTKVFNQGSSQNETFDEIARPMVSKLLEGRSGLLFNYGVTCSGKTYTMTGSPQAPGFLPRALEMIFSSIEGRQTKDFQVQSDDKNGFRLLTDSEMMAHRLEKRNDLVSTRILRSRGESAPVDYDIDEHYMLDLQDGLKHAVFMSYIDIYNEHIYDLLADVDKRAKPVALRIRDNVERGVYAHGVTVKEVRSLDDAFRVYEKGLKQRRNAETSLNLTSSRSHAILTLQVVRVPYDQRTDDVFADQQLDLTPNASSLHLVDLAGSERATRTKAHLDLEYESLEGDRLKEAGSINNSLMTLRRCIDALRTNQRSGGRGNVPYRSSKLTHLFRNFFEVIGGVKLVICVNPGAAEFEENLNVLNFAEAANNIVCKREKILDIDVDEIMAKADEAQAAREKKSRRRTIHEAWKVNEDALATGPVLPCFELFNVDDDEMLKSVINALRERLDRREVVEEETDRMCSTFRKKLNHYERENIDAVSKLRIMEPQLEKQEVELERLNKDNKRLEKKNRALMETQRVFEMDRKDMESELQTKTNKLNQTTAQKRQIEAENKRKMEDHRRKLDLETQRKMDEAERDGKSKIQARDEKLNRLKNILGAQAARTPGNTRTPQVSRGRHAAAATPSTTRAAQARKLRKRSVSESRMLEEVSSIESTPNPRDKHASSTSNLRTGRSSNNENRPPKPNRSTDRSSRPVQPDFDSSYELERKDLESSRELRESKSSRSRTRRRSSNPQFENFNARGETTDHIARRRSQSADRGKWLAHTPNDTVHTGTVLQSTVSRVPVHKRSSSASSLTGKIRKKIANLINPSPKVETKKRVHVPTERDLKKHDKYLLTHQELGAANQLKTTLVKGEVRDTRTGGMQVVFTGKERLTSAGVKTETGMATRRGVKRRSNESEPESMDSQSTAFTDVATRCDMAVVHERGATTAHITNSNNKKKLTQSQTSIRIVDNTGLNNSFASFKSAEWPHRGLE